MLSPSGPTKGDGVVNQNTSHVLSPRCGLVDKWILLCQLNIHFFLQNYEVCCSVVIYLEVYIQAMRVDEAEVNPMASHTGQLAGC